MQNDTVIWDIINHQFCSFKSKVAKEHTFCQNPWNLIVDTQPYGKKKKLWEKIKLPDNYAKALEIVDKQLELFPKYLVHRNKQRLTKIHQMLIRMRRLKLRVKPKIIPINTKVERREGIKERHALRAAQLDKAIETELLERLKQVSEGEIYNYPEKQYAKVLSKASKEYNKGSKGDREVEDEEDENDDGEVEREAEYEDEEDDEMEKEEEDGDMALNIEYVEDFDGSDDDEAEAAGGAVEDASESVREIYERMMRSRSKRMLERGGGGDKQSRAKGRGRVEVEYEEEREEEEKRVKTLRW